MGTPAIGDVIRVTAGMRYGTSDDVQNVYHLKIAGSTPPNDSDLLDDCDAWLTNVYTAILAELTAELTFTQISVYNITQDYKVGETSWGTLTVGSGGGAQMPSGVCMLGTGRCLDHNAVGRKFFGPVTESAIAYGELGSGAMGHMVTAVAAWISNAISVGSHVYTSGVWDEVHDLFYAFREGLVRSVPAYQRRRKTNVGS